MANAVAKASELEMATEQLRAASQAASHMQPPSLPAMNYQQPQHQHHPSNHQHLAARSASLPAHSPSAITASVRQANGAPHAASQSLPAAGGASAVDPHHPLSPTLWDGSHLQQRGSASQPIMHVVQPNGVPSAAPALASQQFSPQQLASPLQMQPHQHQHSSSLSDLGDNEVWPGFSAAQPNSIMLVCFLKCVACLNWLLWDFQSGQSCWS